MPAGNLPTIGDATVPLGGADADKNTGADPQQLLRAMQIIAVRRRDLSKEQTAIGTELRRLNEDLQRKAEDLQRKAEDLQRKAEDLQSIADDLSKVQKGLLGKQKEIDDYLNNLDENQVKLQEQCEILEAIGVYSNLEQVQQFVLKIIDQDNTNKVGNIDNIINKYK